MNNKVNSKEVAAQAVEQKEIDVINDINKFIEFLVFGQDKTIKLTEFVKRWGSSRSDYQTIFSIEDQIKASQCDLGHPYITYQSLIMLQGIISKCSLKLREIIPQHAGQPGVAEMPHIVNWDGEEFDLDRYAILDDTKFCSEILSKVSELIIENIGRTIIYFEKFEDVYDKEIRKITIDQTIERRNRIINKVLNIQH